MTTATTTYEWREQAPIYGTRVVWREGGKTWHGEIFPKTKDFPSALVADGLSLRPLFVTDEEATDILESAKYADNKHSDVLLWNAARRDQRLADRLAALSRDIHARALRMAMTELSAVGLPCQLGVMDCTVREAL